MSNLILKTSEGETFLSDGKYAIVFIENKLILGVVPETEGEDFKSAIIITQDPDGSSHLAITADKIGINGADLAIPIIEVNSHSEVENKRKGTVYTLVGDPSLYIKKTEPETSV